MREIPGRSCGICMTDAPHSSLAAGALGVAAASTLGMCDFVDICARFCLDASTRCGNLKETKHYFNNLINSSVGISASFNIALTVPRAISL